jgi:hypothetical protein
VSRTSLERTVLVSIVAIVSAAVVACAPEVRHPYQADDNTPVNSTSEARLAGEDPTRPKKTTTPESATSSADPTAPQINKVSDMPRADAPSDSSSKKPAPEAKPAKPGKGGPTVSRAECDQVLEKALELEIGSRPEFAGIDKKELIAQAKAMGKQQHGDAPCEATRPQYTCAMAATSTAQWKRCMQ